MFVLWLLDAYFAVTREIYLRGIKKKYVMAAVGMHDVLFDTWYVPEYLGIMLELLIARLFLLASYRKIYNNGSSFSVLFTR